MVLCNCQKLTKNAQQKCHVTMTAAQMGEARRKQMNCLFNNTFCWQKCAQWTHVVWANER